ncbi:DUF397 domain-containing protein [Streptomyces telluris]|uniref:DUF397 domain-containing protein n=1 Tax=Streptomyces telluris TaxID=2720021 RepID=A0A9X2LDJ4_9ACTN|nr:DUF397 domain-containing protein [Streptomyces telluris]MCQ8769337.1 DUF397 domain-containing protein [Streptomyces telluris]NJP80078.1 DUF397 domain-containing protein [Streptomyces telluris]
MGSAWQKSTYSGTGDGNDCVEVVAEGDVIALREIDTPVTVVRATPHALGALIRTLKAGAGHE